MLGAGEGRALVRQRRPNIRLPVRDPVERDPLGWMAM